MKKVVAILFLLSAMHNGQVLNATEAPTIDDPKGNAEVEAPANYLQVVEITIAGNKKTKEHIILREMHFQAGDSLRSDGLMTELQQAQQQIYNLGLFNSVSLNISEWTEKEIRIAIDVTERWYYIPTPIFRLADRNFNVWWTDYNHDFKRTTYGVLYYQDNLRGRNEKLRVGFYTGFSQAALVMYSFPSINKKQTLGMETYFRFNRNREIQYTTVDNKQIYIRDDEFLRKSYETGLVFVNRKGIHDRQYFGGFFYNTTIDDTIQTLNADYLMNDRLKQNFFQLNYRYESDHRNYKAYPLTGYQWSIELEKLGLGIFDDVNYFNVYGAFSRFFDLGKRFYASGIVKAKISVPGKQPYYNQKGLGYEPNFVRGYEFYVVNGQHHAFSRMNLKYNFLSFTMDNSKFIKDERINKIPFAFYLKTFVDMGYVGDHAYASEDPLNNYFLVGGGIGLDMVSMYDFILRIEYSINRVGALMDKKVDNGIYLHFVLDISDNMNTLRRAKTLDPR